MPTRFLAGIKHPSALSHGRDYLAAHGSRREPAAGWLPTEYCGARGSWPLTAWSARASLPSNRFHGASVVGRSVLVTSGEKD